jgi:hypothetical protein
MISRRAWLPLSSIITRLGAALLVSSIATPFSACSEGHYSLGSPGAGESAGGAANVQGTESAAGGSPLTAGNSSGSTSTSGSSGSTGTSGSSGSSGSGGITAPVYHRATAAPCPSQRGPGLVDGPECVAGPPDCCATDAQCTGSNGRCNNGSNGKLAASCTSDECFNDSNCPSGAPCICRSSPSDRAANVCALGGNCAFDSDCGAGGYCSPSPSQGCGPGSYYCHTALDTCTNDADCPAVGGNTSGKGKPIEMNAGQVPTCTYDTLVQHWTCTQQYCSSG